MKRILAIALSLLSLSAMGTTLSPIQLLNPVGSTSGQVIASTGPTTAPAWTTVTLSGLGGLSKANNLSDLVNASAARTNLGLGTSAVINTGTSGATIPLLSAANTWALGQAFTVRPTFNGATPYDTGNLTIANYLTTASAASTYATLAQATTALAATGGSINGVSVGGSNPASGTFTTLKGNSLAKVYATKTSAQSLANGAATTVTGWTTGFDANSNFTASTGTFTAPATGYYLISCQVVTAAVSMPANTIFSVNIISNSVVVAAGQSTFPTASGANAAMQAQASVVASIAAGQTVTIAIFHNEGAAVNTTTGSGANYLSIVQLP